MKAQCFKEKKEITISKPEYVINKINRAAVKGVCPHCGTKVYKLLKDSEIPDDIKAKMAKNKASKAGRGASKSKSRGSRKSRKSKGSRKSKK